MGYEGTCLKIKKWNLPLGGHSDNGVATGSVVVLPVIINGVCVVESLVEASLVGRGPGTLEMWWGCSGLAVDYRLHNFRRLSLYARRIVLIRSRVI